MYQFRSNLYILKIVDSEDEDKIILQHDTPNTEFTATICSLVADENNTFSMAFYGDIFQYYLEILLNNFMKIEECPFGFEFDVEVVRDLKLSSKLTGHVGQSSHYGCHCCLWDDRDPLKEAPERSLETHNSIW